MESGFFTLQDFMVHTKAVIYILIVAILIGLAGFWSFLSERDDDRFDKD